MVITRASLRAARDCMGRLLNDLDQPEAWSSLANQCDEVAEASTRLGAESRPILRAMQNISAMAGISDERKEAISGYIGDSSLLEELAVLEAAEPSLAASFLSLSKRLHFLRDEKRESRRFLAWLIPLAEAEYPDRRAGIWRMVRAALREHDDLAIDLSAIRNYADAEHLNFDLVQQCISILVDLVYKEAQIQARVDELRARVLPLVQD